MPDRELDLVRLRTGVECIDDRACRVGDRKAGDALYLVLGRRLVGGMEPDTLAASQTAFGARNGQVDGIRDHVGEVMQLKGALVRDDRPRGAQRQPGRHHVLVRAGGKVTQPEEATANTQVPAAGTRVVAQRAAVHTRVDRLLCGEVPGLRFGPAIERIVIYVRHIGEFIT